MNKINYDRMCMAVIRQQTAAGRVPTLLLHSCCAPCSSATLEWLSQYFQITVFYYNPNIAPEGEFQKRLAEQRRLIAHQPAVHPVQLIAGDYEPAAFAAVAKGYEDCPEGAPAVCGAIANDWKRQRRWPRKWALTIFAPP